MLAQRIATHVSELSEKTRNSRALLTSLETSEFTLMSSFTEKKMIKYQSDCDTSFLWKDIFWIIRKGQHRSTLKSAWNGYLIPRLLELCLDKSVSWLIAIILTANCGDHREDHPGCQLTS